MPWWSCAESRPLAYATVRAIEPAAGQQQAFLRTLLGAATPHAAQGVLALFR